MTSAERERYEELRDLGEDSLNELEIREFRMLGKKARADFLKEQADRLATLLKNNVGQWARNDYTPDDLAMELVDLVENSAAEVGQVKVALRERLETRNGERLKDQLVWLDSQGERMGEILANANLLLSIAHKIFLMPQGTRCMAMLEMRAPDGTKSLTPYLDPKLQPRVTDSNPNPDPVYTYDKLTDLDRDSTKKADLAPFQRFVDEMVNISERIKNRHFLGQRILDDLADLRRSGL